MIKRLKIKEFFLSSTPGDRVTVAGWVRTKRQSKNVAFIALNDGSVLQDIQIVVEPDIVSADILSDIHTGAAVKVEGEITESKGQGQEIEIKAYEIEMTGKADPAKYPLQPKKHSLEFLRENSHLRFRSRTFGAISRIRHAMIFGVHKFFNDRGFLNIHTPIITGSDCEGAGEMFRVTTLPPGHSESLNNGNVDYSRDFFGRDTKLTVSGQLEAELAALALSDVYTFGPVFRAENSNTSRHLAEFWMVEPEMAFADLDDDIGLAEEFLKYLIQYSLDNCHRDLEFLEKRLIEEDKNVKESERSPMLLLDKLKFILENDFTRLTYTEAIDILMNSKLNKKRKFDYVIERWGADLQSEHERYLVERHFKSPVVVTDYPREIKAFYMRLNDDEVTVRAMDILFPGIGEIVGGSQREERYEVLQKRMRETDIPDKDLWWYLDTRRFGSAPHSGFGLGFERFLQFLTGMKNIRDVIPFPRTPHNAEF